MIKTTRVLLAASLAGTLVLTGCAATDGASGEPVKVSMWSHAAGNDQEIATVKEAITDFNASQTAYVVVLEVFPLE